MTLNVQTKVVAALVFYHVTNDLACIDACYYQAMLQKCKIEFWLAHY